MAVKLCIWLLLSPHRNLSMAPQCPWAKPFEMWSLLTTQRPVQLHLPASQGWGGGPVLSKHSESPAIPKSTQSSRMSLHSI